LAARVLVVGMLSGKTNIWTGLAVRDIAAWGLAEAQEVGQTA